MTVSWRVEPAGAAGLAGTVAVPGDKSIGHRAVLFAALTDGACPVRGLSGGEDNLRTVAALQALGVAIEPADGGTAALVRGVGLRGLKRAAGALDCGNSGTSMRLLAGLLAAQSFPSTLTGDEYLQRRPMRRVVEPLERMGGRVSGRPGAKPGEVLPPLHIAPSTGRLAGIDYTLPVASAQVKSAVLLAALGAEGVTTVREPGPTRDHTERMLAALGAPLTRPAPGVARVDPAGWDGRLAAQPFVVPGDPSSSAFLIAAGVLAGGVAGVRVRGVCVNPTRTGFLDALAAMGAAVRADDARDEGGEPVADLAATRADGLVGVELGGDLVVRAIDEVPVLAVVAACARGTTTVRDASELRVKESDRVATTVRMLRAFGVTAEERPDGLVVEGLAGRPLAAAVVDAAGDHRIAMAAAIAALCADGPSRIDDVANVATSFPTFAPLLRTLGAELAPL
jgi:3-phosphoshikimate 1-carboxyvinyltransferase